MEIDDWVLMVAGEDGIFYEVKDVPSDIINIEALQEYLEYIDIDEEEEQIMCPRCHSSEEIEDLGTTHLNRVREQHWFKCNRCHLIFSIEEE